VSPVAVLKPTVTVVLSLRRPRAWSAAAILAPPSSRRKEEKNPMEGPSSGGLTMLRHIGKSLTTQKNPLLEITCYFLFHIILTSCIIISYVFYNKIILPNTILFLLFTRTV
jgi:hypothetical protein